MKALSMFAQYEIEVLLAALTAIVAYQLLTGRIRTQGLLSEKTKDGVVSVSPARVQLLMFTAAMAVYVLSQILTQGKFPVIETKWLLILGGSHSIYLGGKGLSQFSSLLKSREGD